MVLGGDKNSIGFGMNGGILKNGIKSPDMERCSHSDTFAIVLNRKQGHANCNTVSFFVNGKRHFKPVEIPEHLQDKVLYPIVSFKGVGLTTNLGCMTSACASKYPFTMPFVATLRKADLVKSKVVRQEQPEFIIPVGIPDEGTYDVQERDSNIIFVTTHFC